MLAGIYGDITGKLSEISHFAIWKLCPGKFTADWKIDVVAKQALLAATKQPSQEVLLAAWKEYAPEQIHDLERRMNESGYAFTDDTAMEIAVMDALLKDRKNPDFKSAFLFWGRQYSKVGFGTKYSEWLATENPQPYRSFGNGGAMRVGPLGYEFSKKLVLASCAPTHNHPEAERGALAIADSISLAQVGSMITKEDIRKMVEGTYYYDLNRTCEEIRKDYRFYSNAKDSVSEAIIAFLESTDVQSAIDNAISLGGDSDTQAMMAGNIAQAHYQKVPRYMVKKVQECLPEPMWEILSAFEKEFKVNYTIVD
jgi:ADP-ribosylglycohydrolase